MNRLARILQRHDGKPHFNAKVLQAAGRFDSRQTAYNLIVGGWDFYDKFCDLLPRLPRPVAHDILVDQAEQTGFAVVPREQCDGQPPVKRSVALTKKVASMTHRLLEVLTDNIITDAEDAELEPMLAEIQRDVELIRSAKNKRRPGIRAAV